MTSLPSQTGLNPLSDTQLSGPLPGFSMVATEYPIPDARAIVPEPATSQQLPSAYPPVTTGVHTAQSSPPASVPTPLAYSSHYFQPNWYSPMPEPPVRQPTTPHPLQQQIFVSPTMTAAGTRYTSNTDPSAVASTLIAPTSQRAPPFPLPPSASANITTAQTPLHSPPPTSLPGYQPMPQQQPSYHSARTEVHNLPTHSPYPPHHPLQPRGLEQLSGFCQQMAPNSNASVVADSTASDVYAESDVASDAGSSSIVEQLHAMLGRMSTVFQQQIAAVQAENARAVADRDAQIAALRAAHLHSPTAPAIMPGATCPLPAMPSTPFAPSPLSHVVPSTTEVSMLRPLTSDEVKSIKGDNGGSIARRCRHDFVRSLSMTVKLKHPVLRTLLSESITAEQYSAAVATQQGTHCDEWLAQTILSCIDSASPDGAAFKRKMAQSDVNSGAAMLHYIRTESWRGHISPEERAAIEQEFEQRSYFPAGTTRQQFINEAAKLKEEWATMSPAYKSTHSFVKSLLHHVPDQFALARDEEMRKILRAEAIDQPYELSETELISHMATVVSKGGAVHAHVTEPRNAPPPGDNNATLGTLLGTSDAATIEACKAWVARRQGKPPGNNPDQAARKAPPCTVCGSPNHGYPECTKCCTNEYCKMPFCPKARGLTCACDMPTKPKLGELKDARGNKLASKCDKKLGHLWDSHHNVTAPSPASAAAPVAAQTAEISHFHSDLESRVTEIASTTADGEPLPPIQQTTRSSWADTASMTPRSVTVRKLTHAQPPTANKGKGKGSSGHSTSSGGRGNGSGRSVAGALLTTMAMANASMLTPLAPMTQLAANTVTISAFTQDNGIVEPEMPGHVAMLLDGGASGMILNDTGLQLMRNVQPIPGRTASIHGLSAQVQSSAFYSTQLAFANNATVPFDCYHVPASRRNILSESCLWDWGEVEITKERKDPNDHPFTLHFTRTGVRYPIVRLSNLYWILVPVPKPQSQSCPANIECDKAYVSVDDDNLLWAARMVCDSNGLNKVRNSVVGLEHLKKPTHKAQQLIDRDRFRVKAAMRRKPVPRQTNAAHLDTTPGSTFILDGYGPVSAQSVIDGSTYSMGASCEATDYGYEKSTRTHRQEDWLAFIDHIVAEEAKLGRKPTRLRFDMAGEARTPAFKRRVEERHGIAVELAPSGHHEGVGRREKANDTLARMAESMQERKSFGAAFHLPAFSYAQKLLNRKGRHNNAVPRIQLHTSLPSDLSSMVPYIFGCDVVILNDEKARGAKGTTNRSSDGIFLGWQGRSYIVLKSNGQIVYPRHIEPLDELQLTRAGLPPSAAVESVETQTDNADFPPLTLLTPPAPSAPKQLTSPPTAQATLPKQSNIEQHVPSLNGPPSQRTRSKQPPPSQPTPPASKRTFALRSKATEAALALLECAADNHLEVFNATLHQIYGDNADHLECNNIDSIPHTLYRIAYDEAFEANLCTPAADDSAAYTDSDRFIDSFHLEINKAATAVIDIVTDLGVAKMRVPSNMRELNASPDKEKWIAADRKALDAILADPRNRLVKIRSVKAAGHVIAPCVTTRKIKVDPVTGRMAVHNGYKSRHAYDGPRATALKANKGIVDETPTSSAVSDDLTVRSVFSDAVARERDLTSADIPNAYAHATRLSNGGRATYMACPASCPQHDDEDDELCIECGSPIWGDQPAGYEWFCTLADTLTSMGWRQAEGVPCMWIYEDEHSDCRLATIVDDLLFSEAKQGSRSITKRTIAALKAKFDRGTDIVKFEHDPTAFAGYAITYASDKSAITISLAAKIEQAARLYLPEAFSASGPGKPANILTGVALQKAADALLLHPKSSGRPCKQAKEVMAITGSCRWFEKIMPGISLLTHRLSCVMSNPPIHGAGDALTVARSTLWLAYQMKDVGITYGGGGLTQQARLTSYMHGNIHLKDGAPEELEATADATWTDRNSLYSIMLTHNGADIAHTVKKIGVTCDSSMEGEGYASSRATELIEFAHEIFRALGNPVLGPTRLYTDNKANMLVATKQSNGRARHLLRRYVAMQEKMASGIVKMGKVDDAENPSDYLGKWVSAAKYKASNAYATNSAASLTVK